MKPVLQRLPPLFSLFAFYSPAGRRVCAVCVKLVSLNANATSLRGNFVVLCKGTSKKKIPSRISAQRGPWGLGPCAVLLNTSTTCRANPTFTRTDTKQCVRSLTAWECVNIRIHNQWWPLSKCYRCLQLKVHFYFRGEWGCFSKGSRNSVKWCTVSRVFPVASSLSCSPCQYVIQQTLLPLIDNVTENTLKDEKLSASWSKKGYNAWHLV